MLEGKVLIEDTDMPMKMKIQAMASASQALDLYDVLDCESLAAHIKKEFDKIREWMAVRGGIQLWLFFHTQKREFHIFYGRNPQFSHLQRCLFKALLLKM